VNSGQSAHLCAKRLRTPNGDVNSAARKFSNTKRRKMGIQTPDLRGINEPRQPLCQTPDCKKNHPAGNPTSSYHRRFGLKTADVWFL
jgi:hypothetical protein